jgi:hypothetical protein
MRRMCISLFTVLACAGCPTRDVSNLAPHNEPEQIKEIPLSAKRDIDILFVIDNSRSMAQEQESLGTNFPRFIERLQDIEGGLPNVHVGVVSSDVGISPFAANNCTGQGDDGKLQNTPRGACTPPQGYFISDVLAPDGVSRITNYPATTTLPDVFSCIAKLGTVGCGLEQHLEAMKRALDGHRPENAGFIRNGMGEDPDAFLAVIFLADEDDCSATPGGAIFDPSQVDISDPLGPFGSFRCAEFGIICDGSPLSRTAGSYENCEPMPADQAEYIQHPDAYVDFLKQLKSDDKDIILAGIVGDPSPVNVTYDEDGNPMLDCSCGCEVGGSEGAAPAVRLSYFLGQFPDRNSFTSICNSDLSIAMTQIADLLKRVIGNPCLDGPIDVTDIDGNPANGIQLDCQVSYVKNKGTDQEVSTVIPRCPMLGPVEPDTTNLPCWWVSEEPTICDTQETQLLLNVERVDDPEDTTIVARCVAEST